MKVLTRILENSRHCLSGLHAGQTRTPQIKWSSIHSSLSWRAPSERGSGLQAAQDLLAQSWAAAEQLCGPAPLLVRLAVEAEVRLRDWQALAAVQRLAAETGDAAGALSWESYQRGVRAELQLLQGALPGALQEAQAASASAAAAVAAAAQQAEEAAPEDGEVCAEALCAAETPRVPCGMVALWHSSRGLVYCCWCPLATNLESLVQGATSWSIRINSRLCCGMTLTLWRCVLARSPRQVLRRCLRSQRQPQQMTLPWIWTPQMMEMPQRQPPQLACHPWLNHCRLPPLLQCQPNSAARLSRHQHSCLRPSQQLQTH